MNDIPEKIEMRDRSFSGIQNGKGSMLPAIFRNFRFFSSQSTTFSLIFCFDFLVPEGVIRQFRDLERIATIASAPDLDQLQPRVFIRIAMDFPTFDSMHPRLDKFSYGNPRADNGRISS